MDHKQEDPPAPGAPVRGDFYCPHCEAEFDSQDQLEVHSRSARGAAVVKGGEHARDVAE